MRTQPGHDRPSLAGEARATGAAPGHTPAGAGSDEPANVHPDAARNGGSGGPWLTYKYRLGGETTPEATGTMKAPSFLSAARRVLARGLGETLGPTAAYLRLRAAGEQEVLLRVTRIGGLPEAGAAAELQLDVVPGDAYQFAQRPGAPDPAINDSPQATAPPHSR